MSIESKQVELSLTEISSSDLIILPDNYKTDKNEFYSSNSISLFKYLSHSLNVSFFNTPNSLSEQRSGDWYGPVLLFTSTALSVNPHIVSITCGLITNYLYDFFKSQKKPNVSLRVVYRDDETRKSTELSYEGHIDGIESLKDAVLEISKK
ncbi:MAG: hypothetical protein QS721_06640 [Candidatus Endonucleobacter sp. (ex Gigantidas childressi)]|nr:hypothetical protein [Candidatus Endonucleobacter sp. (ex Gigantidas childressi)]